jgi:xylulokinase
VQQTEAVTDRCAFLGVDLGTSGLKLCLVDEGGVVVAEEEATYDVDGTVAGRAEIDPEIWYRALIAAGGRLLATLDGFTPPVRIRAIGWSGQMHGAVLDPPGGHGRSRAILWPDQRAERVLPRWRELSEPTLARLGNPLVPGMAGPILTAVGAEQPGVVRAYVAPKDWLRRRFTDDVVTERSDASASLLWDVVADDWCAAATRLAGLDPAELPQVVDCVDVVGHTRWPLGRAPVPVVAGGADTGCALTALRGHLDQRGALRPGPSTVFVILGTGIQLLRTGVSPKARLDPTTHIYADCDGGWYEMLAIQNGGLSLSWAGDALGSDWEALVGMAARAPAGSLGARFLPFLTGERGGLALPTSTGGWVGLTRSTGRCELARSVFEGYAFSVRRGLELLGVGDAEIVVSGGGGRDPWVRELLATVLGRELRYVALRSASAVGAAMLAARCVGTSIPVAAELVTVAPGSSAGQLDAAYDDWVAALPRPD